MPNFKFLKNLEDVKPSNTYPEDGSMKVNLDPYKQELDNIDDIQPRRPTLKEGELEVSLNPNNLGKTLEELRRLPENSKSMGQGEVEDTMSPLDFPLEGAAIARGIATPVVRTGFKVLKSMGQHAPGLLASERGAIDNPFALALAKPLGGKMGDTAQDLTSKYFRKILEGNEYPGGEIMLKEVGKSPEQFIKEVNEKLMNSKQSPIQVFSEILKDPTVNPEHKAFLLKNQNKLGGMQTDKILDDKGNVIWRDVIGMNDNLPIDQQAAVVAHEAGGAGMKGHAYNEMNNNQLPEEVFRNYDKFHGEKANKAIEFINNNQDILPIRHPEFKKLIRQLNRYSNYDGEPLLKESSPLISRIAGLLPYLEKHPEKQLELDNIIRSVHFPEHSNFEFENSVGRILRNMNEIRPSELPIATANPEVARDLAKAGKIDLPPNLKDKGFKVVKSISQELPKISNNKRIAAVNYTGKRIQRPDGSYMIDKPATAAEQEAAEAADWAKGAGARDKEFKVLKSEPETVKATKPATSKVEASDIVNPNEKMFGPEVIGQTPSGKPIQYQSHEYSKKLGYTPEDHAFAVKFHKEREAYFQKAAHKAAINGDMELSGLFSGKSADHNRAAYQHAFPSD